MSNAVSTNVVYDIRSTKKILKYVFEVSTTKNLNSHVNRSYMRIFYWEVDLDHSMLVQLTIPDE